MQKKKKKFLLLFNPEREFQTWPIQFPLNSKATRNNSQIFACVHIGENQK